MRRVKQKSHSPSRVRLDFWPALNIASSIPYRCARATVVRFVDQPQPINSRSQTSPGICEANIFLTEFCAFSRALPAIQEVQFGLTSGGREQQTTTAIRFLGNLALSVCPRCPAAVRFVTHAHSTRIEVKVRPVRVNDLLFAHSGHQEKLKPKTFVRLAGSE
jgi:hypothetical protein